MISVANGWTERVKACQLAAYLRGEAAKILQTLPDTEQLNLNLYNTLDLRFSQKYSKDYTRLQMKLKTPENRRKLAGVCLQSRKAHQLGFLRPPSNCARSNLLTVLRRRSEGWGNTEGRARVTADEPRESRLIKEMDKLKEEMKTIKAGISNQEKRNFKCWGCGGTGHLRRNCPRARKEENTVSSSKQEN
ncbi:uncharacterized protein TNCV_4022121 [Trichonephila clavipes]|nr:uncharacterized protein TNCV_4022121 [Trichonephila clavipes]